MIALLFWAVWYPESDDMKRQLASLIEGFRHTRLAWCNVDEDTEVVEYYQVYKVPHILLIHP